MKKFYELCFKTLNIFIKIYIKIFKIIGFYKIIDKNDILFNIYVIPLRIRTILKYKLSRNYSFSYVWDLISKRYFKYRKGECKYCGGCCAGCPQLKEVKGKMLCKIYKRREWCDIHFPISPFDLEFYKTNFNFDNCGYNFDLSSTKNI